MRRTGTRVLLLAAAVAVMAVLAAPALQAQTGNIDPTQQYAWGENAGWLFLRPTSFGGVTVYPTYLAGYAWQENVGWVKFGNDLGGPYTNTTATNWGVNLNSVSGALSGWAWAENAGWILMDPSYASMSYGVTLDSTTHQMSGYAWSENLGWIHFRGASTETTPTVYGVATTCDPGAPLTLTATSGVSGYCGLRLQWGASSSPCGGTVTYTIHRSTTSGFTPSSSTQIATCVSSTTYDSDATAGTYYYRVVAESSGTGGTGVCNGGLVSGVSPQASGTSTCGALPQPFQVFAATSSNQQALLQWVNPATGCPLSPFTAAIRYRSDGTYPVTRTDGTGVTETSQTCGDTSKGSTLHSSLVNSTKYLYSAFAAGPNGTWSAGKTTWAKPVDSSAGKVKWSYTTGASAMVQPGNNPVSDASSVLFVSNDRVLHSAVSGASGGAWPELFVPSTMNGLSQAWPGVVPGMAAIVTGGADRVAFIPSQDGRIYARDVATGAEVWSMSAALGDALQGGVAGIFAQYGGPAGVNRLFVGTRNTSADNTILGINAATGATVWSFSTGRIGIVSSMPAVEYPSGKVFVTSRQKSLGTAQTLWCLTYAGSVCTGWPSADLPALGDIDASPSLRSGSVYVGNITGQIYRVNAATGSIVWGPTETSDGAVRSGLWLDEAAGLVHFSTSGKVWAIPISSGLTAGGWSVSISSPSYPIKVNGEIYVGSGSGRLYQIHGASGAVVTSVVLGDGTAAVGVPTYNALDQMIYVGTEAGVIYAVQVPLQ